MLFRSAIAGGLRAALGVFFFFSLFADNFMSPITHILVGQVMVLRRFADGLPAAETVRGRPLVPRIGPGMRLAS